MNGDSLARPTRVRRSDSEGTIEAPPVYQNCLRLTWLGVHQALAEPGSSSNHALSELKDAFAATEKWFA